MRFILHDDNVLLTLERQATPGPWTAHTFGHRSVRSAAGAVTRALFAVDVEPAVRETMTDLSWVQVDDGPNIALTGNGPRQTENAAFIAAFRNVTPELLKVVAAAREEHHAWCAFCGQPFPDAHTPAWPDPVCSCRAFNGSGRPCPIGPALAALDAKDGAS